MIQRQAERVALGKKARGRAPSANVAEHEKCIRQANYVAEAIRYLSQELRSLLEVVVLRQAGVLSSRDRKLELEALLALLEEVREQALPTLQKEFVSLSKHLRLALPHSSAAVCSGP
jgi:hypothetical protein